MYVHSIDCINVNENVLDELMEPNTPVTIEAMNHFIELVREKYNYNMIYVDYYPQPENYPSIPPNKFDIQIIHLGEIDSGHYICIYFDAYYETVYVYDSLAIVHNEHIPIMVNRIPWGNKMVYVKPKTEQYDAASSGLFAIAYATTIILDMDPSSYTFKMGVNDLDKSIHLREHITNMLQTNELSLFPQ